MDCGSVLSVLCDAEKPQFDLWGDTLERAKSELIFEIDNLWYPIDLVQISKELELVQKGIYFSVVWLKW